MTSLRKMLFSVGILLPMVFGALGPTFAKLTV